MTEYPYHQLISPFTCFPIMPPTPIPPAIAILVCFCKFGYIRHLVEVEFAGFVVVVVIDSFHSQGLYLLSQMAGFPFKADNLHCMHTPHFLHPGICSQIQLFPPLSYCE